ncbi:tRNA 5-methylaminomethyl-2-thiouridine biosynthesis bifunctional protein MnmC [Dissostichus eleginoides]|uniref:tRNA 5-methylaminomethyl-2-thiouridine biosynthesis bifunctional protein MnmC n=1 Tax=Dissostichus eleginoides TaxID=100907 RepID=A0AAD9BQZ7_DISEL|nr:tRNA 5-methylaminomethyl-2-thiouridine biosynthesis bifunctional protein MnmC [Dissostichus eleginoides]
MATVGPFASCYGSSQPLQLFGKGPSANYMSLFVYRGPRCAPRPHLVGHTPKMTLRQICRMLKVMKKQVSAAPAPALPGTKSEKKCIPNGLRHKRSIKRVG